MERIKVESVSYSYQNKYQTVEAVKEVTCTFETGKMYVITGEVREWQEHFPVAPCGA